MEHIQGELPMCTPNKPYIPITPDFDFPFPSWERLDPNDDFPESDVTEYFNGLYHDGCFLDVIEELLKNHGSCSYACCTGYYPNWHCEYQNCQFDEGLVRFAVGLDDETHGVYITEREFFQYAKEACRRFLQYHPEYRDYIEGVLDNWQPKYPDKYRPYTPDNAVLLTEVGTAAEPDGKAVPAFFNQVYRNGDFFRMLMNAVQSNKIFRKSGCSAFYPYPRWNGFRYELPFEPGLIRISSGGQDNENGVLLTERHFFHYARQACRRFLELHPEHNDFIMNILNNWKPKYPDKFPDTIDGNTV